VSTLRTRLVSSLGLLALVVAPACHDEARKSPVLTRELEKICHAVERSGAAEDQTTNRTYLIATWLTANVQTDEGRAWLVTFAKLGDDKAARRQMLQDAAHDHGITDCPLVDFWK
jgi:hypothetical protein